MFLLDTNVISELRRPKPHGAVLAWFEAVEDAQIYLIAVSLGEIQAGIELTRAQDEAKASQIAAWLELGAASYNVLAMDALAFRAWARLMHRKPDTVYEDAMIAATAKVHGLTVVTRNVADFKAFGVPLLNPFKALLFTVIDGWAQRRSVAAQLRLNCRSVAAQLPPTRARLLSLLQSMRLLHGTTPTSAACGRPPRSPAVGRS